MIVDPAVSKRKFEREVEAARAYAPFHRQGVWIIRAEYPIVFVVLMVNKPFPVLPGVLCGIHLDFSDYDVRPPSVKVVDPFDESPIINNFTWGFSKIKTSVDPESQQSTVEAHSLLQAFDPAKPFFCLPGVREYHDCSAHSGESWFLHRKKNMLIYLLDVLRGYGPAGINMIPQYQLLSRPLS